MTPKIRLLLVDDSPTTLKLLSKIFEADPELEVVGVAANGVEAIEKARLLAPDLITMDLDMPVMNGVEATRRIMRETPTPVLVVTASQGRGPASSAFEAINAGAVDVMEKPHIRERDPGSSRLLVKTVKVLSKVKVIRRSYHPDGESLAAPPPRRGQSRDLVAIAASTGGPKALRELLAVLPRDFGAPVLIVQHTLEGFVGDLVGWLDREVPMSVRLADEDARALPGHVYFAPDRRHMVVRDSGRLGLLDTAPEGGHRPAGNVLLRSAAAAYGARAVGVVLTGMGEDGAAGLLEMHEKGAFTIAQDEATSAVYGMPRAAAQFGAADVVLPLPDIGPYMVRLMADPAEEPGS